MTIRISFLPSSRKSVFFPLGGYVCVCACGHVCRVQSKHTGSNRHASKAGAAQDTVGCTSRTASGVSSEPPQEFALGYHPLAFICCLSFSEPYCSQRLIPTSKDEDCSPREIHEKAPPRLKIALKGMFQEGVPRCWPHNWELWPRIPGPVLAL